MLIAIDPRVHSKPNIHTYYTNTMTENTIDIDNTIVLSLCHCVGVTKANVELAIQPRTSSNLWPLGGKPACSHAPHTLSVPMTKMWFVLLLK